MNKSLENVLWLGGAPCSGKSTIADMMHDQYGIAVYHIDDKLDEFMKHVGPEKQPCLYRWTNPNGRDDFWDQIWMRPVDELLDEAFGCYQETFEFVMDDLLQRASDEPLLVEGNPLTPSTLAPIVDDGSRALWMVPSEAFQRRIYPNRGEWVDWILGQCSDPDSALQNWMDRDVAFAAHIGRDAEERGYELITVTGERSIKENADLVAAHFGFVNDSDS